VKVNGLFISQLNDTHRYRDDRTTTENPFPLQPLHMVMWHFTGNVTFHDIEADPINVVKFGDDKQQQHVYIDPYINNITNDLVACPTDIPKRELWVSFGASDDDTSSPNQILNITHALDIGMSTDVERFYYNRSFVKKNANYLYENNELEAINSDGIEPYRILGHFEVTDGQYSEIAFRTENTITKKAYPENIDTSVITDLDEYIASVETGLNCGSQTRDLCFSHSSQLVLTARNMEPTKLSESEDVLRVLATPGLGTETRERFEKLLQNGRRVTLINIDGELTGEIGNAVPNTGRYLLKITAACVSSMEEMSHVQSKLMVLDANDFFGGY
jgi:hypothetical protein